MRHKIKKSFLAINAGLIAIVSVCYIMEYQSEPTYTILLENVEALTNDENRPVKPIEVWCCGSKGTCAKGPNLEIVGEMKMSPCQ